MALAHPVSPDVRLDVLLQREIVDRGVAESAAVAWVRDGCVSLGEVAGPNVRSPLVFDLASVTKPLTATVIARLVAAGRLSLSSSVGEILPELSTSAVAGARIDELLAHRAGLPAWGVLYRDDPWALSAPRSVAPEGSPEMLTRETMLARAASRRGPPGAEVYSDIGYVLLGEIATRALGRPLASAWAELGCADARTRRAADPNVVDHMPEAERVDWRGVVRGEVHDENAAMLERAGGSPGHAGAFGSALEVATFAMRFLAALEGDDALLPPDLARAMIEPRAGGTHTLGWDLRSGASPSSGARFGARTFGHLGFTGTSVWIDPDARAIAVLLTNRTWPTRDNLAIRAARPRVHDALWDIVP